MGNQLEKVIDFLSLVVSVFNVVYGMCTFISFGILLFRTSTNPDVYILYDKVFAIELILSMYIFLSKCKNFTIICYSKYTHLLFFLQ